MPRRQHPRRILCIVLHGRQGLKHHRRRQTAEYQQGQRHHRQRELDRGRGPPAPRQTGKSCPATNADIPTRSPPLALSLRSAYRNGARRHVRTRGRRGVVPHHRSKRPDRLDGATSFSKPNRWNRGSSGKSVHFECLLQSSHGQVCRFKPVAFGPTLAIKIGLTGRLQRVTAGRFGQVRPCRAARDAHPGTGGIGRRPCLEGSNR